MALVEICNSSYKHSKLETFGKKYFAQRDGKYRICEECLDSYSVEVASKALYYINTYLKNVPLQEETEIFSIQTNFNVDDCMKYTLPIKYSINADLYRREYYVEEGTDVVTHYELGLIKISSINCPDEFPKFNIEFEIRDTDTEEQLYSKISDYISAYVKMTYEELADEVVKVIMSNYTSPKYASDCSCSASTPGCEICSGSLSCEQYVYNNAQYCLDCMYGIVVELSIKNNITEDVGLSSNSLDMNSTSYTIVDTPEWKRTVISRYINVMTSLGADPHIVQYKISIQG